MEIRTVNTTFKVDDRGVTYLESYLDHHTELIDYKIVPDTEKLYETDATFRKLIKAEKEARNAKLDYINQKNIL